ncbi:DNA-binding Xre family transcriptional regulator [Laceyella sacchari]|jgi:DNA-binding Xre family transcriptional regulator|uniref:DNA-binding Xre family transcriptional regulator n=1 Tax=Laceyella sediminis TaxID=573074 RepID=A0ABX5ELJ1_9BACL|nr:MULTISPECIES: helix-turn-helix transcriptional regulator [Laceyella]PRZ12958.1 DNA-binding Xre family transcriptional regulator [Laceyella sediminis]TCW41286.1 DNA-binding Xre family transcriptional regulator [Laceyella sacchari]
MEYRYTKEVAGKIYPEPYKDHTFLFRLADLLEKKGYSQRQIARIIDVNHPFINKMANGKIEELPLGHALKLCIELECTLNDLLPIVKLNQQEEKA